MYLMQTFLIAFVLPVSEIRRDSLWFDVVIMQVFCLPSEWSWFGHGHLRHHRPARREASQLPGPGRRRQREAGVRGLQAAHRRPKSKCSDRILEQVESPPTLQAGATSKRIASAPCALCHHGNGVRYNADLLPNATAFDSRVNSRRRRVVAVAFLSFHTHTASETSENT